MHGNEGPPSPFGLEDSQDAPCLDLFMPNEGPGSRRIQAEGVDNRNSEQCWTPHVVLLHEASLHARRSLLLLPLLPDAF